jgi:hypothetical protein
VAKGEYTEGERKGTASVCKWFKSGSVFEDSFFAHDLDVIDKAVEIAEAWNAARRLNSTIIRVNKSTVWVQSGGTLAGQKLLVEPYIEKFVKFNSNTGWAARSASDEWPEVMQALSHFSYHHTSGKFLVCDLQGGVYSDSVVLTDPVIISTTENQFGPTDLGPLGISNFFAKHRCNRFCSSHWSKPLLAVHYFAEQEGTSMVANPRSSTMPALEPPTTSLLPNRTPYVDPRQSLLDQLVGLFNKR